MKLLSSETLSYLPYATNLIYDMSLMQLYECLVIWH